jgi:hypothetical protein
VFDPAQEKQTLVWFNCAALQVQLVGLDEESSEFICRNTFDHPYPTTKLMWIPDTKGVYPDLLATSGDYLRVWRVSRGFTCGWPGMLSWGQLTAVCSPEEQTASITATWKKHRTCLWTDLVSAQRVF